MRTAQPEPIRPDTGLAVGRPGASARDEFERRRQADDAHRREVFGRYLAPVVKMLAGDRPSTLAWDRGGRGEERVGRYLSRSVGLDGVVLHDRAIPGSPANIDHIAVVPSGVWVIDTKQYHGRVEQRDLGGWFVSHPALFVNGHDRSTLIPAVLRQAARVGDVVAADVPLHVALCFADAEWGLLGRPFIIDGVSVTWADRLGRALAERGPLPVDTIRRVAARLSAAFPPYALPGTSHRPTGA
jgi:hypothetical protein